MRAAVQYPEACGPGVLRAALVECSWAMLRYNAWAQRVYDRLRNTNGLSAKKAVVALARKVLVACWGLLKGGGAWRDPCPPARASGGEPGVQGSVNRGGSIRDRRSSAELGRAPRDAFRGTPFERMRRPVWVA
jgi:hypothetical protein